MLPRAANVTHDTVQIIYKDGTESVFTAARPSQAAWFWRTVIDGPMEGIAYVVWIQPGKDHYRVAGHTGTEPDRSAEAELARCHEEIRTRKAAVIGLETVGLDLDRQVRDKLWPATG